MMTATVIAFNAVKSDNRDGYSTSTYRYTIPTDGTYYFSAQCLLNNVPTNTDAVGYLKFVHRDSAETSLGNYVGNYYSFHDFNSDSNFALFSSSRRCNYRGSCRTNCRGGNFCRWCRGQHHRYFWSYKQFGYDWF